MESRAVTGERLPTGTIIIFEDDRSVRENKVAIYARVSSSENKSNLETQAKRLEAYCTAKGYQIVRVVKEVVNKLLLLDADKPGAEIKFYINSPGGVVTSGMVMYDTMKLIQSPVSTICMGLAASMGSILLSAGTKGKRFIYPHGEVMIHQPSLGGYMQATSADIEIQAEQIRKTKEIGARILAENCGKTVDQIMKDFDRDYWMDAKEAVAYGIVDSVLEKI